MYTYKFNVTVTDEFEKAVAVLAEKADYSEPGHQLDHILEETLKRTLMALAKDCHAHGILPCPAHIHGSKA